MIDMDSLEQVQLLRDTVELVYEDNQVLYKNCLTATIHSPVLHQSKQIFLDSAQRYDYLIGHLSDGWQLQHFRNSIGQVSIRDSVLSMLATLALPTQLSDEQLKSLFAPLRPLKFEVEPSHPFCFSVFLHYPLTAFNEFLLHSIIGVELGAYRLSDSRKLLVQDFVITSLNALTNKV